jgi:hypothetical protein
MVYESVTVVESQVAAGVKFTVAKMSFARRTELMRQIRELARRTEFLAAGQDPGERMDAALLRVEIDRLYLKWGVLAIEGLDLDGAQASPETLAATGPEDLFREAVAAVRAQMGLSVDERKN